MKLAKAEALLQLMKGNHCEAWLPGSWRDCKEHARLLLDLGSSHTILELQFVPLGSGPNDGCPLALRVWGACKKLVCQLIAVRTRGRPLPAFLRVLPNFSLSG